MKAEVYLDIYNFDAALEQAWESAQKFGSHFELFELELKQIYFDLEEVRLKTIDLVVSVAAEYEGSHFRELSKEKAQWEPEKDRLFEEAIRKIHFEEEWLERKEASAQKAPGR
jgi:hypothetical protein